MTYSARPTPRSRRSSAACTNFTASEACRSWSRRSGCKSAPRWDQVSELVGGLLDALHAQIDLGLAAVVSHVNHRPEHQFPHADLPAFRAAHLIELIVGQAAGDLGAIVEGIAGELH